MKLIYFSQANLRNNFFIKEFVSAYSQQKGKVLLLHDAFGSPTDTRFVSKRLSSLLSEVMVVNIYFPGGQKGLFSKAGEEISVKSEEINRLFQTTDMLIVNPVCLEDGQLVHADGAAVAKAFQSALSIDETLVFAVNSKSPIVQERKLISSADDLGNWLDIYEEESAALQNAVALSPAVLTSTRHF